MYAQFLRDPIGRVPNDPTSISQTRTSLRSQSAPRIMYGRRHSPTANTAAAAGGVAFRIPRFNRTESICFPILRRTILGTSALESTVARGCRVSEALYTIRAECNIECLHRQAQQQLTFSFEVGNKKLSLGFRQG